MNKAINLLLAHPTPLALLAGSLVVLGVFSSDLGAAEDKPASTPAKAANATAAASAPKAALTVTVATPQAGSWARTVAANGNIAAWQEVVIGAETQGLRLTEVLVNVGDVVRRGQLLARLQSDTLAAEVAASRANLAEAEASLAESKANAERAQQLKASGAISTQQIQQYTTAEATGRSRVAALKARLDADQLRVAQTRVTAPDAGVITARSATVGAVAQPGAELFRLIRQQRLEWRADVAAADLARLSPGQTVQLTPAGGSVIEGKVRMVGPSVDPATRNGIVYVDLPQPGTARAGMFARGEFRIGETRGVTLPATAVVLRDGFSWVYRVGPDSKVTSVKVEIGRRVGDRIEISGGLEPDSRVVAQGAGFLADGDLVKVVPGVEAKPASTVVGVNR